MSESTCRRAHARARSHRGCSDSDRRCVDVTGRPGRALGIRRGGLAENRQPSLRDPLPAGKRARTRARDSQRRAGVNDAFGHAAFTYIESRWGATALRRFIDALIIPRVDRTYDGVFELTPAEFDAAFRLYAQRRFAIRED